MRQRGKTGSKTERIGRSALGYYCIAADRASGGIKGQEKKNYPKRKKKWTLP